jgi:hypothetical protein
VKLARRRDADAVLGAEAIVEPAGLRVNEPARRSGNARLVISVIARSNLHWSMIRRSTGMRTSGP